MIVRDTNIQRALRSRQRGFLLNPFRFAGGGSGGGEDPYADNVSLLLHFDGSTLPQTGGSILDTSSRRKLVTLIGSTQLTADSALFGASGLKMISGGGALSAANSDFALPGDFTLEVGFKIDTSSNSLFGLFNIGNYASGMLLRVRLDMIELFINGNETSISTTVSPFVYHRISLSRISGMVHIALDGTQIGVLNNPGAIPQGEVRIGASAHNTGEWLNGRIDELRLTKGVGRYSGSYVVPTEAFPDPPLPPAPTFDPYWANVVALLHFDGADGATTCVDSGPLGLTVNMSGTTLKTSRAKFGPTGLDLTGSYRAYITHPTAFAMSGPYTIEGYMHNASADSLYHYLLQMAGASDGHNAALTMRFADPGFGDVFQVSINDTNRVTGLNKTQTLNSDVHVAYCRDTDGTCRLFMNGFLQGQVTDSTNFSSCDTVSFGGAVNGTYGFVGGMDEWRITKGVCRYTSNFIAPYYPFPNTGP